MYHSYTGGVAPPQPPARAEPQLRGRRKFKFEIIIIIIIIDNNKFRV